MSMLTVIGSTNRARQRSPATTKLPITCAASACCAGVPTCIAARFPTGVKLNVRGEVTLSGGLGRLGTSAAPDGRGVGSNRTTPEMPSREPDGFAAQTEATQLAAQSDRICAVRTQRSPVECIFFSRQNVEMAQRCLEI